MRQKVRGGRESRVCWSFSIFPSRSTPFPSLPIWITSSRLPRPLTSKWVLHGKYQQDIRGWEKKAPFKIFLLLLPAWCQHRGSGSKCNLHNSSATQVCSVTLYGLWYHCRFLSLPLRPKGGHSFLSMNPTSFTSHVGSLNPAHTSTNSPFIKLSSKSQLWYPLFPAESLAIRELVREIRWSSVRLWLGREGREARRGQLIGRKQRDQGSGALPELTLRVQWREPARSGR